MIKIVLLIIVIYLLSRAYRQLLKGREKKSKVHKTSKKESFTTVDVSDADYKEVK